MPHEALIFFAIFGGAYLLAGLTATLTGEMRVVQRNWERLPPLRGMIARVVGLIYLGWGAVLATNAYQMSQTGTPEWFETVQRGLNLTNDTAVLGLLLITFGLIALPAMIVLFNRSAYE